MKTAMKKSLTVLLTVSLLLTVFWNIPFRSSSVGAEVALNTNLLVNPGGEQGTASYGSIELAPNGWPAESVSRWYAYNDLFGITPHGGSFLMACYDPGSSHGDIGCYQDIDISSQEANITAGKLMVNLTGWLRASGGNTVRLRLQELDASGTAVSAVFERTCNVNSWGQVSISESVLPTARKLRVTLFANLSAQGAGMADDLSLTLTSDTGIAPVVSSIEDQINVAGTALGPIAFTASDADTSLSALTVSVTSSDQTIIPDANITKSLSNGSGSLSLTSVSGKTGDVTVTVAVSDGSKTTRVTFVVTVCPPISLATNLIINGSGSSKTGWTDPESRIVVSSSKFQVATSNGSNYYMYQTIDIGKYASLIDAGLLSYSSGWALANSAKFILQCISSTGGVLWEHTYTSGGSVASAVLPSGTRKIRVQAGGPVGAMFYNMSFVLLNTFPSMTAIANQTLCAGNSTGSLGFTLGYSGASTTVTASSSNTALIPNSAITLGGSVYERTVSVSTTAGTNGTSTITLYADSTAVGTFTMTVIAPPGKPQNVSAEAHAGYVIVRFDAPASDGGSTVTGYTVTASTGGFSVTGSASPIRVDVTNGVAYTFTVTATNAAGTGESSSPSNAVTPGTPSTVVLTAAPESRAVYGDLVKLTATAGKVEGMSTPSGTVTFKDGSTVLAANVALDADGKAEYS